MLKDSREKMPFLDISLPYLTIFRTNCRNFAYGVCALDAPLPSEQCTKERQIYLCDALRGAGFWMA